jgi:hypothetical protein
MREAGHSGADKAYDVTQFVHDLRDRSVTPHIAIDGHLSKTGKPRKTAVDGRTTRHAGYEISQRCRKRIEEVFGWIKSSAGLAKIKLRGRARVDAVAFTWDGSDEMEPASGHGWAEMLDDGSLEGQICLELATRFPL